MFSFRLIAVFVVFLGLSGGGAAAQAPAGDTAAEAVADSDIDTVAEPVTEMTEQAEEVGDEAVDPAGVSPAEADEKVVDSTIDADMDSDANPDAEAAGESRGSPLIKLGYLEDVTVGNLGLKMIGKLDTGADSSSIHAYDMEVYNRSEKDHWVRFRLVGKDGRTIRFDQNVTRFVHIKLKTGGTLRRPVIRLPLCVGGARGEAEINLADRGRFEYDLLIGREFLAARALVDAGNTFIAENGCGETSGKKSRRKKSGKKTED